MNATPFCKNYAKFYFDPKQLEKELDREGVIFLGPFFHEKCPFFIKCTLCGQIEFLEYALQALIPFSEAVHVISSSAIWDMVKCKVDDLRTGWNLFLVKNKEWWKVSLTSFTAKFFKRFGNFWWVKLKRERPAVTNFTAYNLWKGHHSLFRSSHPELFYQIHKIYKKTPALQSLFIIKL